MVFNHVAKKPKPVVCVHCRLSQERVLKQTFLGFFKFTCEECEKESTYPLSTAYVVIYGLAILAFFVGLFFGRVQAVILAVGGGIALAYDYSIRRAANHAKANARSLGEVTADTFE